MFLGHHAMHRRNPDFVHHFRAQKIFAVIALILLVFFFWYANKQLNRLENQWDPTPQPELLSPQ